MGAAEAARPKRYLITGGVGFIGSHLADLLIERGCEVVALDDLSAGTPQNVAHLRRCPRFRLVRGDAGDVRLLRHLLDRIDGVFHLAAAVGVRRIVGSPVRTIENNVAPTATLLREAARLGARVVLASTSEVYGLGATLPFREDQPLVLGAPTHARWSYACSKLLDEFLALAYRKERGLEVAIARIFNTTGPRQSARYGMVMPSLVQQALRGGPLTVYGDGRQTRAFCHVHDTARALLLLMETREALGEIVNVGGAEEVTILALAERVRARVAPDAAIAMIPYEEAYEAGFEDMRRRVPALDKIRALCGWRAERPLEAMIDGIREERSR